MGKRLRNVSLNPEPSRDHRGGPTLYLLVGITKILLRIKISALNIQPTVCAGCVEGQGEEN